MCGNSSGASEICSPTESSEPKSCLVPGEKNVLVVFSSVSLLMLKKCGKMEINTSEDNMSFSTKRMFNTIEWEYFSDQLNLSPSSDYYDYKLFDDCSGLKGMELVHACTEPKSAALVDSQLLGELLFVVTQLKDYLVGLTKEYPSGGKIRLSVCAIHPVECLLFAFQKVLGCSVENESLYLDFFTTVNRNPVLANMKNWLDMDEHKWKVELEYCSVHQLYIEEAHRWTPFGMKENRMKEMKRLRDVLKPVANSLIIAYRAWVSGHNETNDTEKMIKLNENYNAELDKWKAKGFILRDKRDSSINPMSGGGGTYCEPYLEFEGFERRYQDLEELIKEQEESDIAAAKEALKPENVNKRKKEIDDILEVKKKEKNRSLYELQQRDEQIDKKLKELENRNNVGSTESKEWDNRAVQIYNSSNEYQKNKNLIEFEGNLLDADQLKMKKAESSVERKKASSEYWDLHDKLVGEKNNLDSLVKAMEEADSKAALDRVLTGIQLGLAAAGITLLIIVAAPVAAPVAAICGGLAATATVASVGIEVYKWVEIDEGKNVGSHLFSIVLDVISFKCLPIFKSTSNLIGKSAANEAKQLVKVEQNALEEAVRETQRAAEYTASKTQLKEWITKIDNGEDAALSLMKTINTKTLRYLNPEDVRKLNDLISKAQKGKHGARVKKTQEVRKQMQTIYDSPGYGLENIDPNGTRFSTRLKYLNEQSKWLDVLGNESLLASAKKGMNPISWFKVQEGFTKTSSLSQGIAKFLGCEDEVAKIEKAFKIANAVDAAGFYRNLLLFIYGGFEVFHYGRSILSSGFFYEREDQINPNLPDKKN